MTDTTLDAETQKKLDDALENLGAGDWGGVLLLDGEKELADAGAKYLHERLVDTPLKKENGSPILQNLEMLSIDGGGLSDEGMGLILDIAQKAENLKTLHLLAHDFPATQHKNLHEALTNRPPLKNLIIGDCGFDGQAAHVLGGLAEGMQEGTFFGIKNSGLKTEDFQEFAKTVRNSQLSGLNLYSDELTVEALQHIVDAIKETPNIQKLLLSAPNIGSDGAKPLGDLLANAPHLLELNLSNTPLGEEGRQELAESVGGSMSLREFSYTMPEESPETKKAFFTSIMEKNRQLISISSGYNDAVFTQDESIGVLKHFPNPNLDSIFQHILHPVARDNQDTVKLLLSHLNFTLGNQLEKLEPEQLSMLEERKNLAFHMAETQFNEQCPDLPRRQDYEAFIATLPPAPEGKEGWFTANESGFAPVDNPRLWKDAEAAKQTLAEIPLTEAFLAESSPKGTTFLNALARNMPTAAMVDTLNARGTKLGTKELLTEEGKPNGLLTQLLEKPEGIGALFNEKNWIGKSIHEASSLFNALPDDRKDVPIVTLRLKLANQSRSSGMGR